MENDVLFTERQKFRQWWVWLTLLGVNGLFIFAVFKQVIGGQQFGEKPMGNTQLLFTAGVIILLTIWLFNLRLETQIKKTGIYVRFFPFHLSFRHYPWYNISRSFVRKYNPIAEYGGWGIRLGLFGKGKAFNVSGNKGLQLEFRNNKKLLIGTNKPGELAEALNKIGQLKE
ncbi:hypothetical protein [Segetibacter koreensis]|uniref:hypothetical protein n=1 Tax=Segetibacter koreensis TaxID=398037 RepID=UPI00036E41CE|nr:hypothetical protein [Segetibacter koreensis]